MPAPSNSKKKQAEARGRLAEIVAVLFLVLKGYRILATRFRAAGGEIDIVARQRGVLIFVEVKQRPTTEDARLAVTTTNQRRIKSAADAWLAKRARRSDVPLRYDIIAISPQALRHFRDAFR